MPKDKICVYPEGQDKCGFSKGEYCKSLRGNDNKDVVRCIYKYFKDAKRREEK